jgi:hypothetical protein
MVAKRRRTKSVLEIRSFLLKKMEVVCTGAHGLTGPAFDKAGRLFVVSLQSGAVQQIIEADDRSYTQV